MKNKKNTSKFKKSISLFLSACMSMALAVPAFAEGSSESEYVIQFDGNQNFNRIQLMWDSARHNEAVTVDIPGGSGDSVKLTGTADGTTLNLANSSTTSDTAQSFSLDDLTASQITVHAQKMPLVRLFKDEKITLTKTDASIGSSERMFDGEKTSSATHSDLGNVDPKTTEFELQHVSANLTGGVYDISEFVMYTWGLNGWYPKSYKINLGNYETNVTTEDPTKLTDYPKYNPYVLATPVSSASDKLTVSFANGGYSDVRNPDQKDDGSTQNKFGFRIYEIELYGSKAPVWTDSKIDAPKEYTFTADQTTEAEKINIVCSGGDGTAFVKVGSDASYSPVAISNGTGTIALPDGAAQSGVTVSVMRIGDIYPGVELVKSEQVKNFTAADNGKIIVPTEYSTSTSNGQNGLDTNQRAVQSLCDATKDNLGKRAIFYWDKYKGSAVSASDYDFTDCSVWFTLGIGDESKLVSKVELLVQNNSESYEDEIYVTDSMDDYGDLTAISSISESESRQVINKGWTDSDTTATPMNIHTMTAYPNKSGKYVMVVLKGLKGNNNVIVIPEIIITADTPVAKQAESPAAEIDPLPKHEFNLGDTKKFNRVQLIYDNAPSDNITVDLSGGSEQSFTAEADGVKKNFEFYIDSTITEDNKANVYTPRAELSADKIIVHSKDEPVLRLYNDQNICIDHITVTDTEEFDHSVTKLFDGLTEADSLNNNRINIGAFESEEAIRQASVTATLDAKYSLSELLVYTWGNDGWYPKEYTFKAGSYNITHNIDEPQSQSDYPQLKPYILKDTLDNADNFDNTADSFTITFPKGGYSDLYKDQEGQKKYGFRLFEIELYGSAAPVWASDAPTVTFEDSTVEIKLQTGTFKEQKSDTGTMRFSTKVKYDEEVTPDDYGFVAVNFTDPENEGNTAPETYDPDAQESNIKTAEISAKKEGDELKNGEGFYYDFYNVPKDKTGLGLYAVPYIKSGQNYYWGSPFTNTDFGNWTAAATD